MEKRFQVFISSTFQDLQGARQEVSQALLRADCFPAGMELFPAADEEQFEFIKTIIDQSDYYIIISAGRYGSIHPETGLSYTEMEYDYAVEVGKPVIRLLHKDPFNQLKGEYIEKTAKGRRLLDKFRDKQMSGTLVGFWENPRELMAETLFALQDIQRRKPAIGWGRANGIASDEAKQEILDLKAKILDLERENLALSRKLEAGISTISPFQNLANEVIDTAGRCLETTTRQDAISLFQVITTTIEKHGYSEEHLITTVKDKLSRTQVPKMKEIPVFVSALMALGLIEPSQLGGNLTSSVLGTRLGAYFDAESVFSKS